MGDWLLKVDKLTKRFNQVQALDNISFTVNQGEVFGLLGPNGAGKTTLIRIIMDIFEPDSGTVTIREDCTINKSNIGYLPEERGIYEQTKVLETILYFADLKGMDDRTAEEEALKWLTRFNLRDYADSKIEELSKGMKQKVQFIIAIVHQPILLVVDELFSGLDPVNQKLFKTVLQELAAEGTTVLLSSHRMNLVEELCTRIFMINNGHQVLYGELTEIKNNFGGKQVLIAGKNLAVEELTTAIPVTNLQRNGNKLQFELNQATTPQQVINNLPSNSELQEISIVNPPLYEIFLDQAEEAVTNE